MLILFLVLKLNLKVDERLAEPGLDPETIVSLNDLKNEFGASMASRIRALERQYSFTRPHYPEK